VDASASPDLQAHRGSCRPVFLLIKVPGRLRLLGRLPVRALAGLLVRVQSCCRPAPPPSTAASSLRASPPQDGRTVAKVEGVQAPQLTQAITSLLAADAPAAAGAV
jgi:hypothetical protein